MSIEQKINGDSGVLELSLEIDLDQSPIVRENIKELFEKCKSVHNNTQQHNNTTHHSNITTHNSTTIQHNTAT